MNTLPSIGSGNRILSLKNRTIWEETSFEHPITKRIQVVDVGQNLQFNYCNLLILVFNL